MESVGQIVRRRREDLELTLDTLAKAIGATKGYLSMIENHRVKNPPSHQLLGALERALKITDGELIRAAAWESTPAQVRAEVDKLAIAARSGGELTEWLKSAAAKKGPKGKSLDDLYRSGELGRKVRQVVSTAKQAGPTLDSAVPVRFQVPLINRVAAGYPRGFTDLEYPAKVADEYVACPDLRDPQAFAARVVGDSMLPDYREGDVVVFSPAARFTSGSDCFVRFEQDHESTFKRVFVDGDDKNRLRLQPLNPQYQARTVPRDDIAGMYKAVWKFQRLD